MDSTPSIREAEMLTSTASRQWPGERHPTEWDVHDATASPATTFLERFRIALLNSEDAQGCRALAPALDYDVQRSSHSACGFPDDMDRDLVRLMSSK